jgi:outer membrane protein OmpA-like peptidoglycan-associated protein
MNPTSGETMNTPFTFEAENFNYTGPRRSATAEFEDQEAWEAGDAYGHEFESPAAPRATATAPRPASTDGCKYEKGEVEKSRTAQGHLASDVIAHPRGLLIADFGVDWRTPRVSLKRDKALQDWLAQIVQVVRTNPSTTIRVLGFTDCAGNERHNRLLRRGRAIRVHTVLNQMLGNGPQWNAIKSSFKLVDAAPIGEYISTNATIEGRAQNRSVLLENTRTVNFTPHVLKACSITPTQAARYPLLGLIPNVADYQKYVPINYRLDAKKVIGGVAQDISQNGPKAHFWIDLAHWGIVGAEIAAEGSLLVAGLAIASPILAMVANFIALGLGCVEAAEIVAKNWSATGFSRGVVMGADKCKSSQVRDYFANDYFPPNPTCPQARDVAIANYKMGLLVGYVHGRLLCPNQRTIFFRDLGHRMGNQSYRGDTKKWSRREWVDWYASSAAIFRKYHLA